jgi:hypothetical protein
MDAVICHEENSIAQGLELLDTLAIRGPWITGVTSIPNILDHHSA